MRMSTISPATRTALIASVVLPLIALFRLGEDRNWDLANYHLYNPHAWLSGRYGLDVAAAQLQSWHNPLLDVPMYLMVRADLHGFLISLWLTLPAILALFAGSQLLISLRNRLVSHWEMVAFALVAGTGAAFYPTIGSSMNDCLVAAGAVLALAVACRQDGEEWRNWLLAGVILGSTAGLKLTAMLYCIGLAAAALAAAPITKLPARVAALAFGGICGFALTYGFWGLAMWQSHGNPVFPYFNQVFLSPGMPPESFADARFRPTTIMDSLSAPFQMLRSNRTFSEVTARAPLLAGGLISLMLLAWKARSAPPRMRHVLRIVGMFYVVSLLLWAFQSGILRYTTPLEIIAGVLILAAMAQLPTRLHRPFALITCIAFLLFTVRPDWGRRPFSRHFLVADWPQLAEGSMVLTSSGSPVAFFALGLPGNIPMLAVHNNIMQPERCFDLQQEVESRIRVHQGPLWLLEEDTAYSADINKGRAMANKAYGLTAGDACVKMRTSFGALRLCPLTRTPTPIVCSTDRPR